MNPNLVIWSSDWHVGKQGSAHTQGAAAMLAALNPAGVIDTGDCKELHDGTDSSAQLDSYVTQVRNVVPWLPVLPGNALLPILPGNHDDINSDTQNPTDFSMFDARLWGQPYHWEADWTAAQIRFIAVHSIMQKGTNLQGFGKIDPTEVAWLDARLSALPAGYQAIVCSHFPADPAFGNEIRTELGGTELRAVLAAHSARIVAYFNGHRHANMNTHVLAGITHFNGPSVSYTAGNGYGGVVPITLDPAARTLTLDYILARAPFARYAGYVPVVLQLPAIVTPPILTDYSFATTATLHGNGPLEGTPIDLQGSFTI